MQNRILLVGWRAADWKIMLPMIDTGKLPHLSRLIERGVIGKMLSVQPGDTPIAWTSIATGKRPHDHGIFGGFEPLPNGIGARPVTCLGRTTKAIWNILNQNDLTCQVVGWPASHPAESLKGAVVTNQFAAYRPVEEGVWPFPVGCIRPLKLFESLGDLRMHPGEITGVDLLPFVPKLREMETAQDKRLGELARILAETVSLQAVSTELLENQPWDFHAVCFGGIDEISREFINYHPPKPDFVTEEDFAMYRGVIEAAYVYHDLMLGRLVELAGDDATVVVLSDRGCHSGDLRHNAPLDEPGAPPERREVGMFVMSGPGIKQDTLLFGSSILDITPTLLTHIGLAVGRDMEGRVLTEAFEESPELQWIDSWDDCPGEDGQHPEKARYDPLSVPIPDVTDADPELVELARDASIELRFQQAEALIACHREGAAMPILERLWDEDPAESRYGYKLMMGYMAVEQPELARRSFERMLECKKEYCSEALRQWKELDALDSEKLTKQQKAKKLKLWKQSRTNLSGMAFLRAWLLHAEKKPAEALDAIDLADENKVFNRVGLLKLKADCLTTLKRYTEAEAVYRSILELDEENPETILGLGQLHLEMKRYAEAADDAKLSISLRYFNPLAHFLYGVAIYRCGHAQRSADALKEAIRQNPLLIGAYQRLVALHLGTLKDPRQAVHFKKQCDQAKLDKQAFELRRKQGLEDLSIEAV